MEFGATRRAVMGGSAAGLAAWMAACAYPLRPSSAAVQVNLAGPAPALAEPPAEEDGVIRAGFDAVRRMTVKATVNDQGPFDFVVDTGANRSVLSEEIATALALEAKGSASIHGIAGVLPAHQVEVRRFGVGGVVSRRLRMPVLARRYLGADGLLGVDVLSRRRATLDFKKNEFTVVSADTPIPASRIRRDGIAAAPNAVVVPAKHRFGQLTIVDAEMAGVPLTAFLDSGAEATIGNARLAEQVLPRLTGSRRSTLRVDLVSATGQLVPGEMATTPPLRLGGLLIGNLSCVFADLHTFRIWDLMDRPAILVGVDVMRHFESIELDFAKSRVIFTPPETAGFAERPS